ncbi:MAG: hypothetical protein QOJ02_1921 [Acidobacteriota bacterium]|nr:hypothetical protein [Acidobacteriota bacterium]
MLNGAWRASSPDLKISTEELAEIAPLLLGSGAGALGWWLIRESSLSASPAAEELQQAYRLHTVHALLCQQKIKQTVTLLREARIEPILIKGWANARLYPQTGLRPCGDVDLCVRPDRYTEASELLLKMGETRFYPVDLHKALGRLDACCWDEFYERTRLVSLDDVKVRLLAPEDHLRILCVHMLEDGAWRPIQLCDIAAVVEAADSSFDWDVCLGRDKRRAKWVASAIGLAHRLLGACVDDCPAGIRTTRLPRWLMPTVLRHWERPCIKDHRPPELIMNTLRHHPSRVPKALLLRWPDPISATIRLKGSFNGLPRLPFQIGDYLLKNGKFLMRLPALVRARQ